MQNIEQAYWVLKVNAKELFSVPAASPTVCALLEGAALLPVETLSPRSHFTCPSAARKLAPSA